VVVVVTDGRMVSVRDMDRSSWTGVPGFGSFSIDDRVEDGLHHAHGVQMLVHKSYKHHVWTPHIHPAKNER